MCGDSKRGPLDSCWPASLQPNLCRRGSPASSQVSRTWFGFPWSSSGLPCAFIVVVVPCGCNRLQGAHALEQHSCAPSASSGRKSGCALRVLSSEVGARASPWAEAPCGPLRLRGRICAFPVSRAPTALGAWPLLCLWSRGDPFGVSPEAGPVVLALTSVFPILGPL